MATSRVFYFVAALLVAVALLGSCPVNGDIISGELGLDMGMEFNADSRAIVGVKHHFRVETDDGESVTLDLDADEVEELKYEIESHYYNYRIYL